MSAHLFNGVTLAERLHSNFRAAEPARWVVQGCDAGRWLDSVWNTVTVEKALELAELAAARDGGAWRVVANGGSRRTLGGVK